MGLYRSLLITICLLLGLTVLGDTQSGTRRPQETRGLTVAPTMPQVSPGERRVALVMGNDRYQHVTRLERAASDAQAVGVALRALGFEVLAHTNLDRRGMNQAIGALVDRIARGGVGVLFFAGHGVQLGGENFLLPIDIEAARTDELPDETIALGRVLERLAQAQAHFTLVILDACRDNPFPKVAGRTIGGTRGLTIPAAPAGVMVIYSAGINEQAVDRLSSTDKDPHGLFTREFLKYLRQPGLRVDEMLRRVRDAVRTQAAAVGHAQNPAIYDQSSGDFYFLREDTEARPSAPAPPPSLAPERHDDAVEIAFWNSVKDAKNADAVQAYLQQYPKGKFASLARLKIKELAAPPKPLPEARTVTQQKTEPTPPPARPPGTPAPSSVEFQTFQDQDIHFDFGKYDLRTDARAILDRKASFLNQFSSVRIMVEGHTDEREGDAEMAIALGEWRAQAVKNYLIAAGVAPDRIHTISYGKERPLNPDHTGTARATNRRAYCIITGQ
jgi:outer membrane protein OmpA-like peptidoglycan-associated protein